jgi:uroporphyrinogen-III synthase
MPGGTPLAGRTVLITRPEGEARGLAARLAELGARVVHEPVVAFEALLEGGEARSAAEGVEAYDLLVFTSANGARFFAEALRLAGRAPGEVRGRVAAVGPGTARALQEAGFAVTIVAADSRAEGLAAALVGEVRPGTRVLWARPESAREVLPDALRAAGAVTDQVALYRTVVAPGAAMAAARLAAGEVDAVVLASPSAVRFLIDAARERGGRGEEGLRRARRVAIGEVTAGALEAAGFPASAVALAPTDDGLVDALLDALGD